MEEPALLSVCRTTSSVQIWSTDSVDMAGDQDLRPAAVVSNRLRVCKDVEAAFSSRGDWDSFDVIALFAQILLKPFRAFDLVV